MEASRIRAAGVLTALTAYALAVHGYHPYVEDGGLYVAGIKHLLDPRLYPHGTEFVTEHLRFSLFAPLMAALVHATHLSLDWVLLLVYVVSLWATLAGAWMLAARCGAGFAGKAGASSLLACWISLPIAGTSLMFIDPYVTARSLSTPCMLAALAGALDMAQGRLRGFVWVIASLSLAAAMHPLMAGYATAAVLLLLCAGAASPRIRIWGTASLCIVALAGAAVLQSIAPAESADYVRVAMTRYYWFPARWEWFERIGLIAPLLLIAWLMIRPGWRLLGRSTLSLAAIALAVAALFSHPGFTTHLVARMQPLRCYQTVYAVMIVMLGAAIGEWLARPSRAHWKAATLTLSLFAGFGGLMFFVQRNIFPASTHLEMPWRTQPNPWVQAFVWARTNTPEDALFALAPYYITEDGEDSQGFRAIAERSALPDYSKDGGEASITPPLTDAWVAGQTAQASLSTESDDTRIARLKPFGVTWLVLRSEAHTSFPCPYRNPVVKLCRMP